MVLSSSDVGVALEIMTDVVTWAWNLTVQDAGQSHN
jgi:hypothetical protein